MSNKDYVLEIETGITPLLSSSSATFVLTIQCTSIPRSCCFTIKPGNTTRTTTYETSDAGQQVNLIAPHLSDLNIHLAIL